MFATVCHRLSSVTRSISRILSRLNVSEQAIHAHVSIRPHPQTELLAQVQMPARRLQRRASVQVIEAQNNHIRLEQQNNMVRKKRAQSATPISNYFFVYLPISHHFCPLFMFFIYFFWFLVLVCFLLRTSTKSMKSNPSISQLPYVTAECP